MKKQLSQQVEKIDNCQVYFWPKGAKKHTEKAGHEIVVVGAQRITTTEKIQDTVLFVDPNDSSPVGKPRKVYRVSFENFCTHLLNLRGEPCENRAPLRGPFAHCADPSYQLETEEQYRSVFGRR